MTVFRFALSTFVLLFAMATTAVADHPVEIEQELRIVWGGTKARPYLGTIAISEGTMTLHRNLSMQDNAIGVVLQTDSRTIGLQQQSPTNFGGCDVIVKASNSARIQVVLSNPAGDIVVEKTVNLIDVQQKSWIETTDEDGGRIAIERLAHDRLRVDNRQRTSTIYDCNSIWTPQVSGYRTGLSEGEYQLLAAWSNARNNFVANVQVVVDTNGNFPAQQLQIRMPSIEGDHRLELSLTRKSLLSAISGVKPLLSRSVEVVAFDPTASPPTVMQWKPLLAIDPAVAIKPEGLSWLTSFTGSITNRAMDVSESLKLPGLDLTEQLNRLVPFSKAAANYAATTISGNVSVRSFESPNSELQQTNSQRAAVLSPDSWISLPLSGLQPNKPHRLRIQIPLDQPSSLNISVRDGGADRDTLLEPQSSVEIKEVEHSPLGGSTTHEMVFWPRSESIVLMLASASRSRAASVGKILLETGELGNVPAQTTIKSGRQVALYVDQPLLVECYGAPREKDPQSGRYYETWKTWQAIAERLTLHLQLAKANTLVLSGSSGGNSLVQLDSLSQQNRLNKCLFFTDCRSPDGHDFIELLLRHFDRAGYTLILEADFPIAEQFRIKLGDDSDVEQIDLLKGTKRMIVSGDTTASTRLNPLNRKVQAALTEPVKEITQRYASHSSFGGLSLRLDSNSQFLFAGDRWGYNDQLIRQFATDNGLNIPEDPQQRLQLFTGPARSRFVNWRAQQISEFFAKLVKTIQASDRNTQLYINLVRLTDRTPNESDFVEPELSARNPQQVLLSYGVDVEALSKINGLTIAQGTVLHAKRLPTANDWLRGAAAEAKPNPSIAPRAMLVTHQPRALKLSVLEPDRVRTAKSELWIYPDGTRQGDQARRILLEQLWKSDPLLLGFGGWHPVWTGEPRVISLLETFKTLPPVPLNDVDLLPADSPIRMRYGIDQEKGYLSLVNLSPWDVTVQLHTSAPMSSVVSTSSELPAPQATPGGFNLQIPAYELLVFSAKDPSELQVKDVRYQIAQQSIESTAQRLQKLEGLLAQSADPGQQEVLFTVGGTFEQWTSANKPVGWKVSTLPMTTIQRASEFPHSGSHSILMENRGAEPVTAWIQSTPIELPETGRLTLRAWLRASAADKSPPKVRLGLIGRTLTGERYQRSITYGGNQKDGGRVLSNDWGRSPAELHVADVPVDDLVELQVAVDLIGEGRIWVDDVEVVQSWLHPDERNYLRGQVLVVKQKLANNSPFAADRLLSSPWSEYLFELDSTRTMSHPMITPHTEDARNWNKSRPTLQQLRESMRGKWNR
jgi:hypothetical protein